MTRPKPSLLGRIAVHLKLISMEQLARATAEQGRRPEKNLGEIFLELGFLDEKQLARLIQAQKQVVAKQRAARASERVAPEAEAEAARPAAPEAEAEAARPAAPEAEAEAARPTPPVESAPTRAADAAAARPAERPRPAAPQAEEGEAGLGLVLEPADAADRERLYGLLRDAVAAGASDLHLHAGAAPRRRLHGRLEACGEESLDPRSCQRLVAAALTDAERRWLAERGELDFCAQIPGVGRFRANVYRQQRGFDAVFRSIPTSPPSLEELGLPNALARFTNFHQGMVLLTGPAGCGKSSTMAALVNLINEERQEHILCIEDPIEYLHPSKRCLVNQRHAGRHTASFARALRGALREDPDVIVIGELRDLETISLAMTAAETGHFVLATLHTNDAIRTLNRMIGAFPSNQQDQVRTMLSESLRAVVSQRLLNRADGSGRVPAIEILAVTKAISHMIREQKTVQIRSVMQTGKRQGMCLLDQSLAELVQSGEVSREEALRYVEDPKSIPG